MRKLVAAARMRAGGRGEWLGGEMALRASLPRRLPQLSGRRKDPREGFKVASIYSKSISTAQKWYRGEALASGVTLMGAPKLRAVETVMFQCDALNG